MRGEGWERPYPSHLPILHQANYNTPMIESRALDGLISKDPQIEADIRRDSEAALKEKYGRSIRS